MVGDRIREARQAAALSLTEVAAKANISAATLSRIETSKQGLDIELFMTLARILEVTSEDLLQSDETAAAQADPLATRISSMAVGERAKLWRKLAAKRKTDRSGHTTQMRNVNQQVEELLAQVEFLREAIQAVQSRLRKR